LTSRKVSGKKPVKPATPPGGQRKRRADYQPQPDPIRPSPGQDQKAKAEGSIATATRQVVEMRKRGRPPELTPEIHQAVVLAITTGMPETRVGPLLRMDRSIVGKWKTRGAKAINAWETLTPKQRAEEQPYVDFFDALDAALPKWELSNLAVIQRAKNRGDWRAADRLLRIKLPEYREAFKLGGDPENPTPIPTQDVPMTPEEIAARAARAMRILQEAQEEDDRPGEWAFDQEAPGEGQEAGDHAEG
jgi:hypothetical protein